MSGNCLVNGVMVNMVALIEVDPRFDSRLGQIKDMKLVWSKSKVWLAQESR